jgi:hypothetical protein
MAEQTIGYYAKLSGSENHKGFTVYKEGAGGHAIGEIYPLDPDGVEGEEWARRVVACVNFCKYLPTEALEKSNNGEAFEDYADLQHQLAEARAEVERYKRRVSAFQENWNRSTPHAD